LVGEDVNVSRQVASRLPAFCTAGAIFPQSSNIGQPDRIHINGSIMGIERSMFRGEDLVVILNELKGSMLNH
jgi:hypothetical protein